MNRPSVNWEPYAPVADLERRVEELEALNAVLHEDLTAVCNQVAVKCGVIARLEQELEHLKSRHRAGQYRFGRTTTEGSGRFKIQRSR
jgi:uncharacterized coiled-coil protein SlyX